MKHLSTYIILPLIAFQVSSLPVKAMQKDGLKKTIKKEFLVVPDARLRLTNSFGDITCTIWDKNEIMVEVTVSVDTKSEQEAEKIFSQIDIFSTGSESEIEVSTRLAKNLKSYNHFSIDYLVMMPASVSLDLTNKFGDVMIRELHAKSTIRVEYGKASLGKLNHGDNLLEISFGAASVESMKGAVVNIRFSKMRLDYAGSLKIDSKYSDIQAGEVILMEGTFEGGTIDLDHASVLTLDTRFSSFNIGSVKQKISLDAGFGSFKVGTVSPGFKSLVIENQHGSVEIGIPAEMSYSLDAESHFGSLDFPGKSTFLSVSDQPGYEESYRGTVGKTPTATVKIRNEFGSIQL